MYVIYKYITDIQFIACDIQLASMLYKFKRAFICVMRMIHKMDWSTRHTDVLVYLGYFLSYKASYVISAY